MIHSPDNRATSSTAQSRRDWLTALAALASAGRSRTLAAEAGQPQVKPPGFGRAKSVIVVFASGGQSQIDMWDPKPNAPVEVRGAFRTIRTAVPGIHFCEHMPQIAKIANKICVLRTMSHEDRDHGSAFYLSMTGRYHRRKSSNPLPAPDDLPCHGAVLQRVRPSQEFPQTAIHLNGPAEVPLVVGPGQFGGYLGKGFDPLTLGDVTLGSMPIPSLIRRPDLGASRMQQRANLLRSLEDRMESLRQNPVGQEKVTLYHQAFDMLSRPDIGDAFDLSREPAALRARYGRNRSGQACLLARRLVQAGVPLVTVIWSHNNRGQDIDPANTDLYGWDTHNDIFEGLKNHLLPRFDQGFSALVEDLDQQGMLDDTLVVCMGEFGRAPLVALEPRFAGASPGRKHWSDVYSVAFAGAGVKRGACVGESDAQGAYPRTEAYGPWDIMATMFSSLGIQPDSLYHDLQNRPVRICDGQVIAPLFG
ncbi:MAG: DUF1501 domain-containing protein [Planctomycetaceae bacterium]|nr:DUF1501 domain-containing protein [Planctomycetaceae bacterium]